MTSPGRPSPRRPSPGRTPPQRCFPPQPDPGREKLPLVAVTGTNTLLLSAYLDLRNSWQEVRVISVALRSEQAAYRCLLCCQGQLHITTGDAHVHEDHFGFDYGTADIFCFLPAGCPDPSHVAVSVVAAPPAASSYAEEGEEPRFLEVQNRKPIRDDFAHNFTVCLSTMFNFSNVLQLVQSMEMLRLLGVSRVVVYKTSCSADTQKLLDYYEHTGFMEIIPWTVSGRLLVSRGWRPEVSPGQLHYHGQIPALNDCVYRYMYRTRYLGLHDMDEIILPQTVDSWNEMLPLLESLHGADRAFMFENFVFPTCPPGPAPLLPLPLPPLAAGGRRGHPAAPAPRAPGRADPHQLQGGGGPPGGAGGQRARPAGGAARVRWCLAQGHLHT